MFVDILPLKRIFFKTRHTYYTGHFFIFVLIIILSQLHKALHIFYYVPTLLLYFNISSTYDPENIL